MSNCLNEMEATSTGSVISLIELKKCKGYQALSQTVAKDKSIPSKKFLCPYCEGITTNPYECNSGLKKDNKTCDWKVYGLFDLGHVTIFVKDKLRFDKIFTPIDWRKN